MPAALTYPGVHVEELPSGVRTITGVATSITAFVGWAPKGPTDHAGMVRSWSDYERTYGGLHEASLLGYSVVHFFNNGGRQACIVRVVHGAGQSSAAAATTADLAWASGFQFKAKNEGAWGNRLGVRIEPSGDDTGSTSSSASRRSNPPNSW